jgi:hypothetical protein
VAVDAVEEAKRAVEVAENTAGDDVLDGKPVAFNQAARRLSDLRTAVEVARIRSLPHATSAMQASSSGRTLFLSSTTTAETRCEGKRVASARSRVSHCYAG